MLDVPDHAAIDLAVTAAKCDPRNKRFSGLVNALLRKIAQHTDAIRLQPESSKNIPDWFLSLLIQNYGKEKTEAIIAAQEIEPPIDITVKDNPAVWAQKLNGTLLPNGSVRLGDFTGSLTELEGYSEGAWWVQDVAASLPARLFGNIKGKRVGDLCAAPGGKTAELAVQGAQVTAIDLSENRLRRLRKNMERLGLQVETWAGNLKDYHPEKLFDAVLLDAPCSSTGTIRRHPDILWTKNYKDIVKLAGLQFELLNAAIELVEKDGIIVFANCSLAREEGEEMVEKVLSVRKDIELIPIMADEVGGIDDILTENGTLRTTPANLQGEIPEMSGMDGFFAARFRKIL